MSGIRQLQATYSASSSSCSSPTHSEEDADLIQTAVADSSPPQYIIPRHYSIITRPPGLYRTSSVSPLIFEDGLPVLEAPTTPTSEQQIYIYPQDEDVGPELVELGLDDVPTPSHSSVLSSLSYESSREVGGGPPNFALTVKI